MTVALELGNVVVGMKVLGVNCCIGGNLRCVVFTEQTGSVVVKEAEDRTRGSYCDGGGGT